MKTVKALGGMVARRRWGGPGHGRADARGERREQKTHRDGHDLVVHLDGTRCARVKSAPWRPRSPTTSHPGPPPGLTGRCSRWPRPSSPARAASPAPTTPPSARSPHSSSRLSPKLARAVDGGASRAGRGRAPADRAPVPCALRGAPAGPARTQWERDPLFRTPLSLISSVYKIVHFDAPHVQRAMGARPRPPLPVTEPRWAQQVHAAGSWTGGDVECDVVVIGHRGGWGGGRVTRSPSADTRWSSSRRGSSTTATASTAAWCGPTSASTGRCSPWETPPSRSSWGGWWVAPRRSTAGPPSGRRTWVLDRWCEEMGTDAFDPSRMEPYFERVETHLGVGPASLRTSGPIAEVMQRGCDALGWKHGPCSRNAPGCEASGFCHLGCRSDARRSTNLSYVPPALDAGRAALHRPEGRAGAARERAGRRHRGRARRTGTRVRVRARAVMLAGGTIPTPAVPPEAGPRQLQRAGRTEPHRSIRAAGVMALFDEEIRGFDHIPQGYGSEQFLREGLLLLAAQASAQRACRACSPRSATG